MGKRAQVSGSVAEEFTAEFVRNYNVDETNSRPIVVEIGAMRTEDLQDTVLDGSMSRDNIARDRFEAVVVSVSAPRASLKKVNEETGIADASHLVPRKIVVQDCQYWAKQVVEKLVTGGLLHGPARGEHTGRDPREILAICPLH